MLYKVRHLTRYDYSRPVFIEPQTFRLVPRPSVVQQASAFSFSLDPAPAGATLAQDEEDNPFLAAWFNDLHPALALATSFEVRTLRANPFDFLIEPGCESLPLNLAPERAALLARFLERTHPDPVVNDLALDLARDAAQDVVRFLVGLCIRLYETLRINPRDQAGIQTPAETLASGRGACRDAAVLFMDACRAVGLPARYVSGYQEGDPDQEARDLHAWAEVFVPGGGWRGFDPTQGLAVADRHIVLAASPAPAGAAPAIGAFRGTGATSRLSHRIEITVDPDSEENP